MWFILHVVFLTLIVFSIAGPSIVRTTEIGGADFVIAIDTSTSMLGTDLFPSRIDVAKDVAKDFVDDLSEKGIGSDIAIVTFSGSALKHEDFSSDYNNVKESINNIQISDIPGTAIGEAMVLSSNLLSVKHQDEDFVGSIILITDGQSNVGISTERAISYVNENKLLVNTVGIGTEEGAIFENTQSALKLKEEELKEIAEKTGGRFFYAHNKDELKQALNSLATSQEGKVTYNLTPYLYVLILVAVFFEWFFTVTKYRIIP